MSESAGGAAATNGAPAGPIRMVALDMDGTLLTGERKISPRTEQAVRSASGRGVKVVLASARPPRAARMFYDQLGLDTALISYNGALIYEPPTDKIVLHRPITVPLAARIIRYARKAYPQVVVHAEQFNKLLTDRVDRRYQTETSLMFEPDLVAPMEEWPNRPVTKLMLLGDKKIIDNLEISITAQFSEAVGEAGSESAVRVVRTEPELLQIMHPKVSKAFGVALLAKQYGVPQEQVMAVGDAPNDHGMIRWAGWGVAMGNAKDKLKALARAVVADNDHDGVAEAIERWVLGEKL